MKHQELLIRHRCIMKVRIEDNRDRMLSLCPYARLHHKTLCYSKFQEMLRYSVPLLLRYLKYRFTVLSG
jgi:IS1 family transposase